MKKSLREFLSYPVIIGLVVVLILGWLLGELTEEILEQESIVHLDRWVLHHTSLIQNPGLTSAMIFITDLGGAYIIASLAVLAGIFALWKRRRTEVIFLAVVMCGGWFLQVVLKNAIHRARPLPPSGSPLVFAFGWSYPSGHAMTSTIFYLTMAYFAAKYFRTKTAIIISFSAGLIIALMIAFSRVYLQVHYLSDVVAGFITGLLWFTICLSIAEGSVLHS